MAEDKVKKWMAIISLVLAGIGGVWVTNKGQLPNILTPVVEVPPTPQLDENPEGIVVNVPERIKIGQLVILDTEGSSSENFAWKVIPHTDNFAEIDERRRAVFSGDRAGEVIFVIAALIDGKVEIAAYKTVVGGAVADPLQPTVPDVIVPQSGLASTVSNLLRQIEAQPAECRSLRRAFNATLLGMQSGVLKEPKDIVAAQKTATALALSTNTARWVPFKEGLRQTLNAARDEGRLETLGDHMMVWSEIVAGINAYLGE